MGGGEAWLWGCRAPVGFRGRVVFLLHRVLEHMQVPFQDGVGQMTCVFFLVLLSFFHGLLPIACVGAKSFVQLQQHLVMTRWQCLWVTASVDAHFFLVTGLGERTNDT